MKRNVAQHPSVSKSFCSSLIFLVVVRRADRPLLPLVPPLIIVMVVIVYL